MNLSDLLKQDLVEKFESDKDQVGNEMKGAGKNLASAKNMLGIEEWEWAHAASYNAMLHAGRALMFYKGYRPKGHDHHIAVVNFTIAVFSNSQKMFWDILIEVERFDTNSCMTKWIS
ncbi:MAG: HEPN domain-containing protein [Candidatus Nitrosotenuis sp.]